MEISSASGVSPPFLLYLYKLSCFDSTALLDARVDLEAFFIVFVGKLFLEQPSSSEAHATSATIKLITATETCRFHAISVLKHPKHDGALSSNDEMTLGFGRKNRRPLDNDPLSAQNGQLSSPNGSQISISSAISKKPARQRLGNLRKMFGGSKASLASQVNGYNER